MRKIFTLLATVAALAVALLALSGPAAAQAPTTTITTSAASTSAANDIGTQVKRMWFPYLNECMVVGAAGVVVGSWDRWFCSPQLLGGWRLYTNR
ncbi:hypothetical protein ACQP2F_17175 [Actinoplanes sp. CA-030573]|uniref:hypothetical protein n=1 Tax=Actinoplanes sp. CA-030573 TaxID=3239898 RepID=UPI003D8BBC50